MKCMCNMACLLKATGTLIPSYYRRCLFTVTFFTFNEEIHSYSTRTKDNLHLYHSSTTSGLRSVRHKAAVLFYGMICRRHFNKLSHY